MIERDLTTSKNLHKWLTIIKLKQYFVKSVNVKKIIRVIGFLIDA